MARKFIEINSNGDVNLQKEITSTYEKSKALIDAAMGWSKTEGSTRGDK
jgi:hypothetical protein